MIIQTRSVEEVLGTMEPYLPIKNLDLKEWLASPLNVCLSNGEGDFALFEREANKILTGHYFFKSRGKKALEVATEMRDEIFSGDYDVTIVKGITPVTHLGARWLSKKLGFKSYGVVETVVGPCELVMLSKNEWKPNE